MSAKLKQIAEMYLQKSVAIEINDEGMTRIRELRTKEDWLEMEEFVDCLVQATRFLK